VANLILKDPLGVEVTLTEERWAHIVGHHPEMVDHHDDLTETIAHPNVVYEKGEDRYYWGSVTSRYFGKTFLHARVMAKPNHFVVTAWLTPEVRVPEGAQIIWFEIRY
jgi:hypothetical protein